MEVSIHELLAAAREAVKSDYIKGESILCETRYHPDTHYMVEIEMLKTDNTLGKKGAYIRKFLTEDEYSSMLQKQEEHLIKIKRQAIVQKGTLRYIPLPDRLDSRRKRDIFKPAGKEQGVFFKQQRYENSRVSAGLGVWKLRKVFKTGTFATIRCSRKRVLGFMPDEKMKEVCDCDDSRN